jgi:hypothetical protein
MILCFLGGIGSGKTVSLIKEIIKRDDFVFTNFDIIGYKKYHRLMFKDIFREFEDKKGKKSYDVNWNFWKNQKIKDFSICLDEVHNLVGSRNSQTTQNKLLSKWVAQVRKLYADSQHSNLYILSQTIRRIDVDFRDLVHIIVCHKCVKINNKVWIKQYWYDGMENYLNGRRKMSTVFLANPYFKYYDTKKIVFDENEKYL